MMLDIAILTGLLYLTGGPHNPFSFLYLVQIALATVLVRALWTWMLVALSFVGFGILLLAHQPLDLPEDSPRRSACGSRSASRRRSSSTSCCASPTRWPSASTS